MQENSKKPRKVTKEQVKKAKNYAITVKKDGIDNKDEMRLLRVRGLFVSFPTEDGGRNEVVKGIHFSLREGEILGIAGESGSGKSMTALSVMGLLPSEAVWHVDEMEFEGECLFGNMEKGKTLRDRLLGKELTMVFQEPLTSLNPLLTIGQQLRESLKLHTDLTKEQMQQRMISALSEVELDEPDQILLDYPHQLSGGMRQRVMIAMAMLHQPKLLIADEPTTALDSVTEKEIVRLIKKLSKDHKTAILFISHNLNLLHALCDRVLIMKDGMVVERGTTEEIFTKPKKEYTKELIAAVVTGEKEDKSTPDKAGEPLLTVKNLTSSYFQQEKLFAKKIRKSVLKQVSFEVREGEIFGVVGESGCGKSTLLKVIAGLLKADSGEIIRKTPGVQMVFQDPYTSLNPAKKVSFLLEEPLRLQTKDSKEERQKKIRQILKETELPEEILSRRVANLSGGQRQRVAIAAALIANPKLVLLDEPVSALDVTVQAQVLLLLLRLQKEYHLTYLFVSHDMAVVRKICDRVLVMKDGSVVECNETEELIKNPKEDVTRKIIGG